MTAARKEKPPYTKYAFMNAYNLGVLGGALTVAAATQNWWIAAVGVGVEGLWMLFAPDSRLLQRTWFDRYHERELAKKHAQALDAKLLTLDRDDASRAHALSATRDHILQLATENPAFTQDLLRKELGKLDQLVVSFVDLAVACTKYLNYLRSVDANEIEREARRYRHVVDKTEDAEKRALAQKNLAVLIKRQDKYAEIARDLQVSRGQLDLIENTFRLLADQIVTMRSPAELTGQLDELMDGVDAIQQTSREAEKFLAAVEQR